MAFYLNRTVAVTRNESTELKKSPLQAFVGAKKRISDIYGEMEEYVVEVEEFINALHSETKIVNRAKRELFKRYILGMSTMRKVLLRLNMKVAFFGSKSNGRSSVINAMLHENILPTGIGHTANCFCQVEGSDRQEPYLMTEGSEKSVVSNKQLANALCQEKLSESSLVRLCWPRTRCSLLRDDVIFVDSPGVNMSANLDNWIDNHCLNADVFVLVLNAESMITRAEKQFFHTVLQKLSKPKIFILINRWDASASAPECQESVKSLYKERCINFLTNELKVSNVKEAAERVFFVSALETLQARLEEVKGNLPHMGAIAEGFHIRYFEFQDFERKFEECISHSAVKTKFDQHSSRGKSVASDMRSMLDNIFERISIYRNLKLDQRSFLTERIKGTETQITREMKLKIQNMVAEVEQKVAEALNKEICRLSGLIDTFNMPFYTDPLVLNIYKKEMNAHVESGLGSNLRARLWKQLAMNVEATQLEMTKLMHAIVPNDKPIVQTEIAVWRPQPFNMLYPLNGENLCDDFHEDLDFKFSWGITAMMARFTGNSVLGCSSKKPELQQNRISQSVTPPTPVNETPMYFVSTPFGDITPKQMSMISRFAITSIGSQSTVGSLVIAGIGIPCFEMLKTIGWRIPVGVGALYGCTYLYERLSWTNAAKERAFKAQFQRHATKKLKMIVDLTSAKCSDQVEQKLWSTFARLRSVVEDAMTDMNEEIKEVESKLVLLEMYEKKLKFLRNKANYIQIQLEIFENNYIRAD